ncbi:enoyl-CoA hydratase/isomerase family protein [Alcaligenaceae bacterium CGII-47]|nr:enoyl-CoA hydratase/isomerase family protein [Alcaligenaceae bacterium CGII-47]
MTTVDLSWRDSIAVLRLNRPDALNALNAQLIRDISDELDRIDASNARVLLITGAGSRAFCAGADIKELSALPLLDRKRTLEYGQKVFAKLDALRIPSIALINGYALGGGLELALACTFRLASRQAKLSFPEIKLGLIPGYGGTQRLPRLIGTRRALDMVMTGRTIDCDEALSFGLVDHVIEGDLLSAAIDYASKFCCYGLPALQLARETILRSQDVSLHEGMKIEADLASLAMATEDAAEGMRAFIEKRTPVFQDR